MKPRRVYRYVIGCAIPKPSYQSSHTARRCVTNRRLRLPFIASTVKSVSSEGHTHASKQAVPRATTSLDLRTSLFPLLPLLNFKRALVAGLAGPTPRIAHLSLMDADAGIWPGRYGGTQY
jgi:hypothetical protein